jgi:two-component system, NtrC family, sensor histidine kinase HydH
MLPSMPPPRRVTPLAGWSIVAVFLLIGIALLATVWTTRSSVIDASETVGQGQAYALVQQVRNDVGELGRQPSSEDLTAILATYRSDGLRYVALEVREGADGADGPFQAVADAGQTLGRGTGSRTSRRDMQITELDGRLRVTVQTPRAMRTGNRRFRIAIELEPVQAAALRESATLTLGVGALAAASLLAVAMVLVRREARRNAEAQKREREKRLASLGEMSAILAHEIKNPLASLKGNAQLLAAMLPEGEKPRGKAERVVDEAVRLEQLTNELLQFVRTGEIRRAPTDPGALVRDAATSVPGDVVVDATAAPRTWSLDAGRIREVVVNLVDNAVAAGAPVHTSVRAAAGRLVIEVADHGPGVPEEDRDRIFEPFFTGKTQGTGLGLAVVRRVIEQHGGTIAVLNNPGGGALFRAEIPEA